MATLALLILAISAIVNTLFGLTVLIRTYQRAYGWYFAITILGVSLWAIGDAGILFAKDPALLHVMAELFYIAPLIIPVFIWFFALSFPENRKLPLAAPITALIAFSVISLLFLFKFHLFVTSIVPGTPFNTAKPHLPGFLIYSSYFSLFFLLTYAAFIVKLAKLKGISHTQVGYTFWGALTASVPALITNLSFPVAGITHLIWLGPFFTLVFAGAVTAAIIRHRLFNIRLVLARSVGYILSVGSLAMLYGLLAFVFITSLFRDQTTNLQQQLAYALLAAVLAFTFPPLKRFFERMTNKLFYRDAYDPQIFLDQLNRSLVANTDLERMLKEAAFIIQSNLKSESCVFGVLDSNGRPQVFGTAPKQYTPADIATVRSLTPHMTTRVLRAEEADYMGHADRLVGILNKNNIAILGRLVPDGQQERQAAGYLLLGSKKSGNPYTTLDIQIIEIIINELVIAVENALRFQQIERFNETLQQKIEEATRKLRRSNDKLRKLDETKDDFISMASHQLRTPLTSVKGYVSMVLDGDAGKITSLQRKLLNQSFISSQRMVYLISDLLNVSRLRTGKFVIEPMPTNLAKVVQEEVDQLIETVKGRHLELLYERPEHFPLLMLDETKLRQVIMNFIDNAVYYTPSGGHIIVRLEDKPRTVEFTVTDDGIGVPKHEQHHLFTKFFRAHNAKRARPDGTGLGLFMAKKVIIAQGGATIFRSQEGKGSTFGFTFAKEKMLPPQEQKSR
jgi:signal transduction histidine kinase